MHQKNFSSPEMQVTPADANLLEHLRFDQQARQKGHTRTNAIRRGFSDPATLPPTQADLIDAGFSGPLPVEADGGFTPAQAAMVEAGLAAGKTLEDIAMDNINDGGDDDPAQFSS